MMLRNTKQRALYEVIKSQKPHEVGQAEQPDRPQQCRTAGTAAESKRPVKKIRTFGSRQQLKLVPTGIELSVTYPVVVVCFLATVLLLLVAFKLGQTGARQPAQPDAAEAVAGGRPVQTTGAEKIDVGTVKSVADIQKPADTRQAKAPVASVTASVKKDHVIVIATYKQKDDLLPVQTFFAANGIATDITGTGGYYLLVTKERFENTERSNSDGFIAKQKIKEIGLKYQAPKGYESFRSNLFQDAYGMKVK